MRAAYQAFWQDVYEARKRHRVVDVVLLSRMAFERPGGPTKGMDLLGNMGDESSILPMLARAYGQLRRELDERIDRLVSGEPPKAKPKRRKRADG